MTSEEFYKYMFGVVDAEDERGRKQIESNGKWATQQFNGTENSGT